MGQLKKINFNIISMATYGYGLSGGDRIWIELAKRLRKECSVSIYAWEEGIEIARREGLEGVQYVLWSARVSSRLGFFINYFARVVIGLLKAWRLTLENSPNTIVYSASEFWQDTIPAVILKSRYPKIRWVAAWYQTAPNPLKGFSEGKREAKYRVKALAYWLVQQPIKPLIEELADLVIVNNESERKQFLGLDKKNRVLVMLGAVDLDKINFYKFKYKKMKKIYDGVFQGRFHPQKGVLELVDIWKKVVVSKPNAKLAMIGDGPLMESLRLKVKSEKLENNVKLFGYLFDGPEKYKIFAQSKVVLHPAFYDSGGMAAAEAMAFGIPAVGFNLKAYESYYPSGMLKVPIGDVAEFSNLVLDLLDDESKRNKMGRSALVMLNEQWTWDFRAKSLLSAISS